MNGYSVVIDGETVECEARSFDFIRFERHFDVPFSSVAFGASRGEMRLEHLYWLAFCAWQRTTGDTETTFDEWGDCVSQVDRIDDEAEDDDAAPLDRTA